MVTTEKSEPIEVVTPGAPAMICRWCGLHGHLMLDCRETVCTWCDRFGHFIEECPNLGWTFSNLGSSKLTRVVLQFHLKHVQFYFFEQHATNACSFYFYSLPCIMHMLHASDACLSFMMLHIMLSLHCQTHVEHALTITAGAGWCFPRKTPLRDTLCDFQRVFPMETQKVFLKEKSKKHIICFFQVSHR